MLVRVLMFPVNRFDLASRRCTLLTKVKRTFPADDGARQGPAGRDRQRLVVWRRTGLYGIGVDVLLVVSTDLGHIHYEQAEQGFMGVAKMKNEPHCIQNTYCHDCFCFFNRLITVCDNLKSKIFVFLIFLLKQAIRFASLTTHTLMQHTHT